LARCRSASAVPWQNCSSVPGGTRSRSQPNSPDSPDEDLARLGAFRDARPGLRLILLSTERRQEAVLDALRHGVFAYFSAPFDREEVRSMIHRALVTEETVNAITLLSASRQWLGVRVSCRLLTAERLVQFMKELRTDLQDPERDDLMLAFRELLLNAMEHGAGFDPEQVIEVHAIRTAYSLIYCFRDPGPGFRGKPLPHAAVSYAPGDALSHTDHRAEMGMRPGGFGILLARHYADELIWNEAGNELIMVKHLG
jgi:anti-sigma regulatory factor (Ser/Thr protein kinase)